MQHGSTDSVLCCLLALVISVDICQGKIKSFTVSSERGEDCILLNTDVVLVCDVDDDSSTIAIKRLQYGALVGMSRVGEKSLKNVIYNVSCSDSGAYECILDHTELLTADLVIAECPLQPCHGADVNRTLFVDVSVIVHFSACVLTCVGIAPEAKFNDIFVRKENLSDWTSDWTSVWRVDWLSAWASDLTSDSLLAWKWNYAPITSTGLPITRFNVHVTRYSMDTKAYGLLRVRLFSNYGEDNYLDFHILLHHPGPPDCPRGITVSNYRHDYVILSWEPGLNGGSRQHFYVYYSKDKATWVTHGSKTENTTERVSGLSSNTGYYFRVASGNEYSTPVYASTCTRTVFVTTKSFIKSVGLEVAHGSAPSAVTPVLQSINQSISHGLEVPERSNILMLTLGECLILGVMLLLSALFCWRRKGNREHKRHAIQGQEEIPMEASQTGSSTCPGGYVTVDDIGYSLPSSQ